MGEQREYLMRHKTKIPCSDSSNNSSASSTSTASGATHSAMSSGIALRPVNPASRSSSSSSSSIPLPPRREGAPPPKLLLDFVEPRLDLACLLWRLPRAMFPPMLCSTSSSSSDPGAAGALPWGDPGRSFIKLRVLSPLLLFWLHRGEARCGGGGGDWIKG